MKVGNKTLVIALLFAGLVLVNYLASTVPFRLDVTEGRVYTLSEGTRALLAKVEEPVSLDFYFSRGTQSVPVHIKNFADRIQEMLRQYVRASDGKVTLNVVDPRPDTPEEERATASGLRPTMLQTGESFTFGLVATQADQSKVIATFNPERESFLEYDISELIHSVQQVDKRKLGLVTGLPLKAPPMDYMMMQQGRRPQGQLISSEWEKTFQIVPVESSATTLPEGLDVLVIAHPQNLTAKLQYAIDRFLLSGKPVLVAVDPASQHAKRQGAQGGMYGMPQQNASSDLATLFKGWGVTYDPTRVVGDLQRATKVQTGAGSIASYPIWLNLVKQDLSRAAQPTAQLNSLLFVEAGSLGLAEGTSLTLTPLVQTTEQAGDLAVMETQFAQPDELGRKLTASGRKTLAALYTGNFRTAFPAGEPADEKPAAKDDAGKAAAPAQGAVPQLKEGKGTLIVVADTDWLLDDYSVRRFNMFGVQAAEPLNDNLYLGLNLAEFLGGSSDLVSIRGKGTTLRPFTVVQRMEADAQRRYQDQLAGVEAKLAEVQRKLNELQGRGGDAKKGEVRSLVASPEVRKAVEDYQKQEADARRQRREIRRALREDIDSLENWLVLINLLVSPVLALGIGYAIHRSRS